MQWGGRRAWLACVSSLALGSAFLAPADGSAWPSSAPAEAAATSTTDLDRAFVEAQTVCVGSRVWAAGTPGDTLLYRLRREGDRLYVGYFAYWSTERPWGNNLLSYAVLPALFTDALYSHFMFVLPGVREVLYGPGDVEGATVVFEPGPDGLVPVGGIADDERHHPVSLSRDDVAGPEGRVVLVSEVWSHQLGAHGAASFARAGDGDLHCFGPGSIRPLTDEIAASFHLGTRGEPRRAKPAWRLGGG